MFLCVVELIFNDDDDDGDIVFDVERDEVEGEGEGVEFVCVVCTDLIESSFKCPLCDCWDR